MGTLEIFGLIFIGIGIGFILTKGYQMEKDSREKRKKDKEK